VGIVLALKVADRQHHAQLGCELGEALQHRVALKRPRQVKVLLLLLRAKVRRLEQLLPTAQLDSKESSHAGAQAVCMVPSNVTQL